MKRESVVVFASVLLLYVLATREINRDGDYTDGALGASWTVKTGAILATRFELARQFPRIAEIYRQIAGRNMVITSGVDGTHALNSKHYLGLAIDIRVREPDGSWALSPTQQESLRQALIDGLDTCSVIIERDPPHAHIQYDGAVSWL